MSDAVPRLASALAGRYRIEREIGAGGMATVYLARDVKHDRDVALKVLHPELGAVIGADRFLQEIKTTARLQHPHILGLIDSGEAEGLLFYVMPFVNGESLRNRLNREKQLPISEALRIATEVASALDYAHRHGVVHRDIKPENVLLHDGQAMVADFGIALAVTVAGGGRMTQTGMSLGTPHYMSPEQALGEKEITPRSDVYALGAMTYEMLTGDPPFTGSTAQAILAKVMNERPVPPSTTRETVAPHVEAAVLTALAKLPADRWGTAKEFADALANPSLTASTAAMRVRPVSVRARYLPWTVATVATVATALVLGLRRGTVPAERVTAAVVPLEIRTPSDRPLNEVAPPVVIAPDGSYLVFVGPDPDEPRSTLLWRRPLDQLAATPIPGSRGAGGPQILADGKTIQFFARNAAGTGNTRYQIGVDGGLRTEAPYTRGIKQLNGGRVLAAGDSGPVLLGRGQAVPAPTGMSVSRDVLFPPDVSPDQKWLARPRRSGSIDSIVLHPIQSDGTIGRVRVLTAGTSPRFLGNDLLIFRAADGTLQAGRLNADRTGFAAPPVPLEANVSVAGDGKAVYDIGADGTLIYVPGGVAALSRLAWVSPSGHEQAIANSDSRTYGGVALSPDGRRAAVTVGGPVISGDVWIVDLALGSMSPLTSDGMSARASWQPNGRFVSYLRPLAVDRQQEHAKVSLRAVDASAPANTLAGPWPATVDELVWSPDARYAAIRFRNRGQGRDVAVVRVGSDSLRLFAADAAQERGPRFSPDGNWLLYVSDRSGRDEIYAESFPNGGNRVQLSLDGGREAVWSRDGSQVFYRGPDGWMMAARVTHGPTLTVTSRQRLFDANPYLNNPYLTMYDVAPDGRFLMIKLDPQPARTDVVVIRGWAQQVKARMKQ